MGDKMAARRVAMRMKVPVVPGTTEPLADDAEAARVAAEVGYPVMIKAAMGGGGKGMRLVRQESELTEALRQTIRARIRGGATPRHVPARIVAVTEIPRTRSGKISEIAVRDTLNGRPIANDTALANPECMAFYRDLPELADG